MTHVMFNTETTAIEPCVIDDHRIRIGDLVINLATRSINSGIGREVSLSNSEFIILATLAKNAGRFVAKHDLVAVVARGALMPHHSSVDVFVKYLRTELTVAGSAVTVEKDSRLGYRLCP